jgi:hypothetical protein
MSEHKVSLKWARNGTDSAIRITIAITSGDSIMASRYRLPPRPPIWAIRSGSIPKRRLSRRSSCHMLTFLALASNKGFVVDSYEDNAVGHVEKNANGKLAITRVDLHPNIAYGGAKQPTPADLDWLHDKAHRECFIANSVTTKISVAPTK